MIIAILILLGFAAAIVGMVVDVDQLIDEIEGDELWDDEEVGAGDLLWASSATGADDLLDGAA